MLQLDQLPHTKGLFIGFPPKATFIFLWKHHQVAPCTRYRWLWHTSAHRVVPDEEVEAGVQILSTGQLPINLIWHTDRRTLGKTIEPSPCTLKLLLQKSQLKGEEEREGASQQQKRTRALQLKRVCAAERLVGARGSFGAGGGLPLWICQLFLNWLLVLILSEKKGVLVW